MKRKFLSIIIAISVAICSSIPIYAEETSAYDLSLARLEAAYDYLNEVYLDTNLGSYIEYATQTDIDTLQKLANDITIGCYSDEDKCYAIWNWMDQNVKVSFSSYAPIDVFRTLSGVCSGHAQLMSALMKLSGVRAAVVRGYLLDTNTVTLNDIYAGISEGHQWVMAYYNNDWHLFDDLWGECGNNNKEDIASRYYTVNVDGISAYTEAINTTQDEFRYGQTIYKDGEFVGIQNGDLIKTSGSNFSYGGCLRYCKTYYWDGGWEAYYTPLEGQVNNQVGYAIKGGYYSYLGSIFYVKENGITLGNTVVNYNNQLILMDCSDGVIIDESIDNNGLSNGELNMYLGETIDLSSLYPEGTRISNRNTDKLLTDGLSITAIAPGSSQVRIINGVYKVSLHINVYGDSIYSKPIFKDYCGHTETHVGSDECTYCDYCGLLMEEPEEEIIIEPIVEELIAEPVAEEEVIEEPINEVVEELTDEVMEEPITEEVIENPVIEEQVEEVNIEPVEKESTENPTIIENIINSIANLFSSDAPAEEVIEEPQMVEELVNTEYEQTVITEPQPEYVEQPTVIEEEQINIQGIQEEIIEPEPISEVLEPNAEPKNEPTVVQITIELPEEIDNNQAVKTLLLDLISNFITSIIQFVVNILKVA